MCGRYTNTATPAQIAQRFSLSEVPEPGTGRYNIAPTDEVLILTRADPVPRLRTVRWGLIPAWAPDRKGAAKMINARCETVATRPAFAPLVRESRHRCLVLADGYYEWLKAEDPKQPRAPIFFSLEGREPFAFAGLWTRWRSPDGETVPSCTILTTRASSIVAPIHSRMPLVLAEPEGWHGWLDPGLDRSGFESLIAAECHPALVAQPANPIVNSVRNEGPQCLQAQAA